MTDASRRGFLATAGVGAAAIGMAAVAPSAGAAKPTGAEQAKVPAHASGSMVAHVADVHGDTVTLFVGEREVVVRDKDLVARLARAVG